MSDDWTEGLSGEEREEWDRFVAHQREHTVRQMAESAFVMSLVPDADKVDVKFAVELGFAIMLGKPIMLMVLPGTHVPYRLRKIADDIIVADLDTEAGKEYAARRVKAFTTRLGKRGRG